MNFRHDFHTAIELCNGKVLVVGPAQDAPGEQRNAELYDPTNDTWTSVGPMNFPHDHHTATLIPAGCGSSSCQVLIAGGGSAQAETYQVDTGQWRKEKPMNFVRSWHTATPVVDGCRVLVAGGLQADGSPLRTTEIYDAVSRTWSWTPRVGDMHYMRYEQVAGALPGGSAVVMGGFGQANSTATAEVWNPATGRWTDTAAPNEARRAHSGCALNDGRFMVIGGQIGQVISATADIYDSFKNTWTLTPAMSTARTKFTCTTLRDGRVLVAGGVGTASSEIFVPLPAPGTGTWIPWADLVELDDTGHPVVTPRYAHAATLLRSTCGGGCQPCQVMVTGGYDGVKAKNTTAKTRP
jgi:hypothetical protein